MESSRESMVSSFSPYKLSFPLTNLTKSLTWVTVSQQAICDVQLGSTAASGTNTDACIPFDFHTSYLPYVS